MSSNLSMQPKDAARSPTCSSAHASERALILYNLPGDAAQGFARIPAARVRTRAIDDPGDGGIRPPISKLTPWNIGRSPDIAVASSGATGQRSRGEPLACAGQSPGHAEPCFSACVCCFSILRSISVTTFIGCRACMTDCTKRSAPHHAFRVARPRRMAVPAPSTRPALTTTTATASRSVLPPTPSPSAQPPGAGGMCATVAELREFSPAPGREMAPCFVLGLPRSRHPGRPRFP